MIILLGNKISFNQLAKRNIILYRSANIPIDKKQAYHDAKVAGKRCLKNIKILRRNPSIDMSQDIIYGDNWMHLIKRGYRSIPTPERGNNHKQA